MSKKTEYVPVFNFTGLLALIVFGVFFYLKMAGVGVVATWGWLWVTSPLWIYVGLYISTVAIILGIGLLCLVVAGIFVGIAAWLDKKK